MKNEQIKPTEEMRVCASFVREVKTCAQCSSFALCKGAMRPVSRLGIFAAKVALCYIPQIRKSLLPIAAASVLNIELRHATEAQEDCGALCSIGLSVVVYNKKNQKNVSKSRRVPVYENDGLETLKEKCLAAYMGIWKGLQNGK